MRKFKLRIWRFDVTNDSNPHARAALFVEQMKADVVVFDGRIELNRNGDETEGEDAAEMGLAMFM